MAFKTAKEQDIHGPAHIPHHPSLRNIAPKPSPKRASGMFYATSLPELSRSTIPFRTEKLQETSHSRNSQWYETEQDIARTTLNFVTSLADDPKTVKISRNKTTLDMTMEFTHHTYKWSVEFPSDFPRGSVKLKKSGSYIYAAYSQYSYSIEGLGDIYSFKTKLKSTLLETCTTCGPRRNARTIQGQIKPSAQEALIAGECNRLMSNIDKHLESIQGMVELKNRLRNIARSVVLDKQRRSFGVKINPEPLNLVFMGNPGTGKTTVARLFAAILKDVGVIAENKVVEVQRDNLVGVYIGRTEANTTQKIREAEGGILFIDEAYQLYRKGGSKNDFGGQAIGVIMKHLNQQESDQCKTVFILAGYEREMKHFMSANKGLFRRFREPVYFRDYTPTELGDIMKSLIVKQGFFYDSKEIDWVDFFSSLPSSYLALFNAAICARSFSKITEALNERLMFATITKKTLFHLTKDDVSKALTALKADADFAEQKQLVDKATQVDSSLYTYV